MTGLRGVCLLGVLCGAAGAGQPLSVRVAHYRIKIPADPGSATVLVRNPGERAVTIDRLMMDGSPLPAEGIGHGLRGDPERERRRARWASGVTAVTKVA